jgi:threonine/homoserine/homoserine lactone efflux protein
MTTVSLIAYCIALAIAVAIPGPGIMALLGTALGRGFKPAFAMLIGITFGDLTWLTLAILGLAAVSELYADAFLVAKIIGAAYLLYLAYKFWMSSDTPKKTEVVNKRGIFALTLNGYIICLSNPKPILFYLALAPVLLDMSAITLSDYFVILGCTAAILLLVAVPYLLLAAGAREWLSSTRVYKWMNRSAAVIIGAAALAIGFRAH